MSDRPSLTTATAVNLKAYHPEIPPEKLGTMVARTFVGGFFVLLALVLFAALIALPALTAFRTKTQVSFSMTDLVFGAGAPIALALLGAQVWSSQLVAKPLALTIAALKGVWQTVKGS